MAALTLTNDIFEEEVLKSDIPVLVDFWASWCGPCKMFAPFIESLSEDLDGQIKVGKVNIDDEAELASKYNIMSIPTVILFKDGQAVKSSVGVKTKAQLIEEFGL